MMIATPVLHWQGISKSIVIAMFLVAQLDDLYLAT